MTARRALQSTRDGAAIRATAGRLAGLAASVDLLAAVPSLVAELPPAPALGAAPPDLELLGTLADRAASYDTSRPARLAPPGSRQAATAAGDPAHADGRPVPLRYADADGPTETSLVLPGDEVTDVGRRLSPAARVEQALRHLDPARRSGLDRRVGPPVVAATAAGGWPRRTVGLAHTSPYVSRRAQLPRSAADLTRWQPTLAMHPAGAEPGPASVQVSNAAEPDATQPDVGDAVSGSALRPASAHHSERATASVDQTPAGGAPRRLADLPQVFADDAVPASSATGSGDDSSIAAAKRGAAGSPAPAVDATQLEELLAELLVREAEAHGLDGRLT